MLGEIVVAPEGVYVHFNSKIVNIMKRVVFIFFCVVMHILASAQSSIAYQGGKGNGYSSDEDVVSNNEIFIGGSESGAYSDETSVNNNTLYQGGSENGAYSSVTDVFNFIFYKGSSEDGVYSSAKTTNNNVLFLGGSDDGYSSFFDKKDFIWTGATGTGWSVAGNWNYNVIPDINRRTIIPADVPNFPFVNAGLFAIGENPNNGAFKSGELIILPGALLVTRVNCRVENYGLIQIEGHMNVKRTASNAFMNLTNGQVIVKSNGLFSFQ